MTDNVKEPSHYTHGRYEVIEILEGMMSKDEFKGFLRGNFLKYVLRYQHKGKPLEDLNKAGVYLTWLQEMEQLGEIRSYIKK